MASYAVEPWREFAVEAAVLWPLHWEEIAIDRDKIKLAVDFASFDALDAMGQLHVVVAREAGVIVGYWLGIIRPHLHYRDSLTAYTDVFYVRQESRRDVWVFQKMLDFVEKSLKQRGVQKLFIASKSHKDLSRLFERRQMNRTEVVYTKVL